jgi:hypothetical protein
MNEAFHHILLQLPIPVFVAVTVATLTAWLSLRRFYREKWWEAKLRAYSNVIEALHHQKRDMEVTLPAIMEGRDTDSDFFKELENKSRAAWADLLKHADIGDFIFSRRAAEILNAFLEECKMARDPNAMYFEVLDARLAAVNRCLPAFKAAARSDLRLPRVWRPRKRQKSN